MYNKKQVKRWRKSHTTPITTSVTVSTQKRSPCRACFKLQLEKTHHQIKKASKSDAFFVCYLAIFAHMNTTLHPSFKKTLACMQLKTKAKAILGASTYQH